MEKDQDLSGFVTKQKVFIKSRVTWTGPELGSMFLTIGPSEVSATSGANLGRPLF